MKELGEVNRAIYEMKMEQAKDKELIFDSLDQGIMIVQDSIITFKNEICSGILQRIKALDDGQTLLKKHLFKLFENASDRHPTLYCISDIVALPSAGLQQMLFELNTGLEQSESDTSDYRFIQIKKKVIDTNTDKPRILL